MNRYRKFVYEDSEKGVVFSADAKEGLTFEVVSTEDGTLRVKAVHIEEINVYSENYNNPPVPEGYGHVYGTVDSGFVIERLLDESLFTWVPVGMLDADATLDGIFFLDKFGRRNFMNDVFDENNYKEDMNYTLSKQLESVKKYGGFYISSYNISKSAEEKPQSIQGVMPWVNIDFEEAKRVAEEMEDTESVESHLVFGAEYDSVLAWFLKSNARNLGEIIEDSTECGNYWNAKGATKKIVKTGSNSKWCTNNIHDFFGNVDEWTQEKHGDMDRVIRGGCYVNMGEHYPGAYRASAKRYAVEDGTGFRVALYIE